jgi:hypothetical protein
MKTAAEARAEFRTLSGVRPSSVLTSIGVADRTLSASVFACCAKESLKTSAEAAADLPIALGVRPSSVRGSTLGAELVRKAATWACCAKASLKTSAEALAEFFTRSGVKPRSVLTSTGVAEREARSSNWARRLACRSACCLASPACRLYSNNRVTSDGNSCTPLWRNLAKA